MSRIHDILNKADRDGTARRVRPVGPATEADAPIAGGATVPAPVIDGARQALEEPAPRVRVAPLPPRQAPHAADGAASPAGGNGRLREIDGVLLDPVLIAASAPHSLAAEQYRSLRTRIVQAENGRPLRTIAITSPGKGDGKSVNAANLALTMAQEFQRRVVLVDGDLRRPRSHQLLGLTDGAGLADVLMGTVDLDTALISLPEHNLTVLPAGIPPSHPAELLSSSTMRRVIEALRQRFDRIVIDMPPVAPLADVHILAPLLDAVVLIVRAGVTPKPAIERALSGFDRAKVLGLVLNEAGMGAAAYPEYAYLNA
ncbi:MAG TPA: CpsD/CapB family tyrosine-protein kinase [Vicinamibacterales bacterium]|nr:CpsD/CapB family tyrosine-protein kinase [Vicinamibacterales bacterium]